jgi:hypothetical protein
MQSKFMSEYYKYFQLCYTFLWAILAGTEVLSYRIDAAELNFALSSFLWLVSSNGFLQVVYCNGT